jgi:hypothetical protein
MSWLLVFGCSISDDGLSVMRIVRAQSVARHVTQRIQKCLQ